jgi:hypothetical protein
MLAVSPLNRLLLNYLLTAASRYIGEPHLQGERKELFIDPCTRGKRRNRWSQLPSVREWEKDFGSAHNWRQGFVSFALEYGTVRKCFWIAVWGFFSFPQILASVSQRFQLRRGSWSMFWSKLM